MSKKGIVCEIKKEYCVFLTADGQFMRGIPVNANVLVGEEADFHEFVVTTKRRSIKRTVFPIIAAAAIFILLFATVLSPSQSVYAYVQVGGIETVEFGVDESGQVIDVRTLSGKDLEYETSLYKGKPFEEVIENLILSDDIQSEIVSITTVYTKKAGSSNSKKAIEQAISDVKGKFDGKEVSVFEATEKDRNEANEKGLAIQQHLKTQKPDKKKPQNDQNKKPDVKAGPEKNNSGQKSQSPKKPNEEKNQKQNEKNTENNKGQHPNSNKTKKQSENDMKLTDQKQDKKDQNADKENSKNESSDSQEKKKDSPDPEKGNDSEDDSGNGNGKENGNGHGNNKDKDKGNDSGHGGNGN